MSATIYYQPVKGKALSIGASSNFLAKLREAFGVEGEIRMSGADYHRLQGLRAGLDSDDQKAAVDELLEAIVTHDEVRVWPEY